MAKQNSLAEVIATNLNKASDEKIAFFLDSDASSTLLTDFISTGSSILDIAISNRPHGGIACGRITELQGLEQSGKSLVSAHMLASTQKRGGVAVLIDTETALNYDFFEAVGLDFRRMVYVNENKVEQIFTAIEKIIETVRKSDKDKLVCIVVDSLSAATTESEAESDHKKEGYATDKIALVFTNQLRQKLNAMPFGDQYTTSGGKALGYHASTRIRFKIAGSIKNKNKDVIGVKVKARITKNRLGPPHREAVFYVYFDRGVDDYSSWYEVMKDRKLFKQSGAWATWTDPDTGEEIKFQKNDFEDVLLADEERKEKIYQQLCEAMIMTYADREGAEIVDESPDSMDD